MTTFDNSQCLTKGYAICYLVFLLTVTYDFLKVKHSSGCCGDLISFWFKSCNHENCWWLGHSFAGLQLCAFYCYFWVGSYYHSTSEPASTYCCQGLGYKNSGSWSSFYSLWRLDSLPSLQLPFRHGTYFEPYQLLVICKGQPLLSYAYQTMFQESFSLAPLSL